MRIRIDTRLPGLNEYITAINRNKYVGNALKRDTEDLICLYISSQRSAGTVRRVLNYPVSITFEWHETTKRRDLDNIASAKKFILDALQKCGILDGDGQKYVSKIDDVFFIPDEWDGVEVCINPI